MNLTTIELIGAFIGLVYIFLEYRASGWLWIAGIVMSLFYIYIFVESNCYAWAFTYLYYLGANVYGIVAWGKKHDDNSNIGISALPQKYFLRLLAIIILLTVVLTPVLLLFTDTIIPISESFSTALSVIGMWLLAKKYLQHWYVWMGVNAIYTIANLWIGLYYTSLLFFVFFIVSVMGLVRWRKLAG